MTTIGRRSFVFLVLRLIAALLGYVGFLFLTKYLGTTGYGQLALVMSLVATFNCLSDLGFSSAHIRKINEGKDLSDCVSTYATVKVILTGVTIAITVSYLLIWPALTGAVIDSTTSQLIILFLLYTIFINLAGIPTGTFGATLEAFKSQTAGLVEVSIRVPLIVIFMVGGSGVIAAGYAYVIAAIGVTLFSYFLLFRDRIKFVRPTLLRDYWRFSMPLALVSIIGTVGSNLPNLTLGYFFPYPLNTQYVAYYSGASFFLGVFALIGTAVATMTFPSFSRLHVNGNMDEIRRVTCEAERYVSIIGMPITTVMVVLPTQTAAVMIGGNFGPSAEPLRWLALSTMLVMLNQVHTSQILAVNRPDLSAKITVVSFVVLAITLFLLVPTTLFGAPWIGQAYLGAAVATFLTTAVMFIVVRYIVYKLTKTGTNIRIGLHVVAGIYTGVALLVLTFVFPLNGWLPMIAYGLYALGIFAFVLWALGELHKADVRYFWNLLNVKELWGYIRGEMKRKESP